MSFSSRAASIAAISFIAVAMLGTTTAGAAQEIARAPISALNALTLPQVPLTSADDAPAPQAVAHPADTAAVKPALAVVREDADDTDDDADQPEFATLTAAVAAQDGSTADDRELQCLASGVFHESHGEPLAGQLAVAQTIVNRAQSGRFPKSICSVLTQKGQFSFVRGGVVPMPTARNGWKTAVAVAKVAYRELWKDVAPDALFFHARHVSPGWRLARVATIGNHIFYR